jgi:hypothetical protein
VFKTEAAARARAEKLMKEWKQSAEPITVQTNGGPLDGAKLVEVDAFYREKTAELDKEIKRHLPGAPDEAIRYIGTNTPTKNRPGLPVFQDDYFTGSSFTLQKNPKGHLNEGAWETPFEALARKRAQFEGYPQKQPHEMTYEEFAKGPPITDPSSPMRQFAQPALKVGDEYAIGYNTTTHLGVYEELMNEGSWPVDYPLEEAQPAWIVNGKPIIADPGGTARAIHKSIVEKANLDKKVLPKAVKEQYPDLFRQEVLDREVAIKEKRG